MTIKKEKDCMQLYVNQILTYNLGTARQALQPTELHPHRGEQI